MHFRVLKEQEQFKSKGNTRKEILIIRAEIIEVGTKKQYNEWLNQRTGSLKELRK